MSYSVDIFRFGPELNYDPKIKNLNMVKNIDQLYNDIYDNLIIIFTKLDELDEINLNKIKYGRLFIIINSDDSIPNLRERFAEHIPEIDRRFLYILNCLHPNHLIFDHIKNNLVIRNISFISMLNIFLIENFSCLFIKSPNIKYIAI